MILKEDYYMEKKHEGTHYILFYSQSLRSSVSKLLLPLLNGRCLLGGPVSKKSPVRFRPRQSQTTALLNSMPICISDRSTRCIFIPSNIHINPGFVRSIDRRFEHQSYHHYYYCCYYKMRVSSSKSQSRHPNNCFAI